MSCDVCPGPEAREISKVVGARNMSECGGKTACLTNKSIALLKDVVRDGRLCDSDNPQELKINHRATF